MIMDLLNKLLGKESYPKTFEGGVFTITSVPLNQVDTFFEQMSEKTRAWTARAARGECGWICADCCSTFPEGMPDQCVHGSNSAQISLNEINYKVNYLPSNISTKI